MLLPHSGSRSTDPSDAHSPGSMKQLAVATNSSASSVNYPGDLPTLPQTCGHLGSQPEKLDVQCLP